MPSRSTPARTARVTALRDVRSLAERAAPGIGACVLVLALGFAGGGYLPRTWRLGTFSLLALAAAALVARRRIVLARLEWCFLAALAALAAWILASAWWSDRPATSILEAERAVVYVAAVVAVLLAAERTSVPQLLAGVVAGVTVVSAYGLGHYLLTPRVVDPIEGSLLFEPLGYANGFGIYAGIGIVLAIGLALAYPRRAVLAAATASLAVLVPTLYYTSSRAAWVAVAAGVATILLFGRRTSTAVTIALSSLAVVAVVGVALASSERGVAARLVGENRPHYWDVAWKEYELHPALGGGAGTFSDYWLRYRPITPFARDAHSLYLESLAELGPVGLGLVVVALGLPLLALRGRRDPPAATAAGGYVAYLVHAGVDWDWELPATTVAGLVSAAALLVAVRSAEPQIHVRTRAALLLPAVAFGVLALIRLRTGPALPFEP